jgi:hypothetical protein
LVSREELFFKIEPPDWLERISTEDRDFIFPVIINTILPTPKFKYDKACNILVFRNTLGGKEILLGRRIEGGVGGGEPGHAGAVRR